MRTATLIAFLALSALSIVSSDNRINKISLYEDTPILNTNTIEYINSLGGSWQAKANPRLKGLSVGDFKRLLGVKKTGLEKLPEKDIEVPAALPTSFDARQQWPACATIGAIRDQGHCGSCWAFGCAEVLSDRFCIQGKVNVTLSPQDLTSCDDGSGGCDGGEPLQAWNYAKDTGIVEETCYPYAMGTCKHPGCTDWPTPSCNTTCQDGSALKASKHYAATAYSIPNNADKIATEIMTNGPVEVAFEVYEDFATYASGVYVHKSGALLGGHAVKAVGWGVDAASGLNYWLIANSWNTDWGLDGYFKIVRGQNECGIEDDVVAGLAKV